MKHMKKEDARGALHMSALNKLKSSQQEISLHNHTLVPRILMVYRKSI
jgi:hypothetical protein